MQHCGEIVMASTILGPCLVQWIPPGKFTKERSEEILDSVFRAEGTAIQPNQREGWQKHPDWRTRFVDKFHQQPHFASIISRWIPSDSPIASNKEELQFTFDGSGQLNWTPKVGTWIDCFMFEVSLENSDLEKVERVVSCYQTIVAASKPTFAFIDHWNKNVKKSRGQNPLNFGWGAMYFGTELIGQIGRDTIDKCSAETIQWVGDGVWVFSAKNPWECDGRAKNKIAKELNLATLEFPA